MRAKWSNEAAAFTSFAKIQSTSSGRDNIHSMRLLGVNIPDSKRTEIALTYVYGIGRARALSILAQTKINPAKPARALTPDEVNKIQSLAEKQNRLGGGVRPGVRPHVQWL